MITGAKKGIKYSIMKDELWLAKALDLGVREFISGELQAIPTGIYTDRIECAVLYDTRAFAEELARKLGGKVYEIHMKGAQKRCDACRYNLGGGHSNCRINLEAECAAGEYEAWESKDD